MAEKLNKDAVYRAAKPQEKDYFINDGGGLYLRVKPSGAKNWQFVYGPSSARKRLSIGNYPAVTLEHARREAAKMAEQVAAGTDPAQSRKEARAIKQLQNFNEQRANEGLPTINSFADVAGQWLQSIQHLNRPATFTRKVSRLRRLAFPVLGNLLITEIKSPHVLAALKPLIDKGQLETAHRLHGEISSIFAYAAVHNLIDYDPSQAVGKQIPPQKVKHPGLPH